jgi:hypothetical protein
VTTHTPSTRPAWLIPTASRILTDWYQGRQATEEVLAEMQAKAAAMAGLGTNRRAVRVQVDDDGVVTLTIRKAVVKDT